MYITRPTHGAGTEPSRTQPPTATRKTTLNAGQCVRQPREGRGRNRQTPPPKKNSGGGGGGQENGPQLPNRPPTPQKAAKPPSQKAPKTGPPKGAQGDHPAKTGNTKPGKAANREKGHPQRADTHHAGKKKKKKQATQPEREGMGGQGPQGPTQGQPATDTTKPKQDTQKKKTQPDNPTKKGGEQPRPGPSTHAHTAHPSQERQGTSGAHAQTRTPAQHSQPGGAGHHASRAQEHTHTQTPPQGVAGCSRNPNSTPHTGTGNGGVQAERARNHARPICRPKPEPNHEYHKPQHAKEGRHHKAYPNTPAQDPGQDWRGYVNPNPTATRTQTQTPHNSRKPRVHSPRTEAARAMQLTRPKEIRRPGVRLHPKTCAALGLEAERATPQRLGTLVPRTCMHALGTGCARASGEPPGFRPKKGTCVSTGAHPPGETSTSRRRRSALPVMPGAALLGANSQV